MSISISYTRIYEQQHGYYKSSYVYQQLRYVTIYNIIASMYNVNRTTTKLLINCLNIKLIKKRVI